MLSVQFSVSAFSFAVLWSCSLEPCASCLLPGVLILWIAGAMNTADIWPLGIVGDEHIQPYAILILVGDPIKKNELKEFVLKRQAHCCSRGFLLSEAQAKSDSCREKDRWHFFLLQSIVFLFQLIVLVFHACCFVFYLAFKFFFNDPLSLLSSLLAVAFFLFFCYLVWLDCWI